MTYAEEIDQPEERVSPEEFVSFVTQSENLAAEMDDGQLVKIGQEVIADYDMDKDSMSEWLERMEKGIKLAKLLKEDKSYPFDKAANIRYPLVAQAALSFNARSYPAIVPPDRVVKAKVWGSDPQGQKAARADRVSEHMSWQLSAQIEEWEEETDKLLVQLPLVGTMVRKWWLDPVEGRARCRTIAPGKFIVNDKVKNLQEAPRLSEELPLYPAEIETRIRSGQFVDFDYNPDPEDKHAEQEFIEQHTRLDLDEDGYDEPYIVTVHKESQKVVRIVADFSPDDVRYETETQTVPAQVPAVITDGFGQQIQIMQDVLQPVEVKTGILAIRRGSYFVSYQFMPSMDGGFFGTGLGLLLGDISEAINSTINMLLDAGHYASLGGGFIGSNFRIKGGKVRMAPGEWKMMPDTGSNIRESMVPMNFPGADAVLFQMLGMMIDAGEKLASTQAIMTGDDGGKNMQPTTVLALIDQGMQVFTAVYKRVFRSLKGEYKLLAGINAQTVSPDEYNAFHDDQAKYDPREEYSSAGMDIQPVADPASVMKMAERAKAQVLMQLAEMGMVSPQAVLPRITEAMDIEDAEELMPQPDPMQQQMMMMQAEAAHADLVQKKAGVEKTLAEIEKLRAETIETMTDAEATVKRVQLDAISELLKDERDRLGQVLSGVAGLARTSGNGNAAQGGAAAHGGPQAVATQQLLAGAGGAGIGAAGPGHGGGVV